MTSSPIRTVVPSVAEMTQFAVVEEFAPTSTDESWPIRMFATNAGAPWFSAISNTPLSQSMLTTIRPRRARSWTRITLFEPRNVILTLPRLGPLYSIRLPRSSEYADSSSTSVCTDQP